MDPSKLLQWIQMAYKKFKSSVYFDRANPLNRERILTFETALEYDPQPPMEQAFEKMAGLLLSGNEEAWEDYQAGILENIHALCYPKALESSSFQHFFSTAKTSRVQIKSLQYMIDMPVEGHILGVLWILLYGYQIDGNLYEKAYANRIRKTLFNELTHELTYSPHLFEPYFQQYQSWRDSALEDAQNCLRKNSDVVILTLDLARYYYSVDLTPEVMEQILQESDIPDGQSLLIRRLSRFIAESCRVYAALLPERLHEGRAVLPIGFLPSNILGNWFLSRFDQAVTDHWNPLYYGRYVDDILIVDKIESNSDIGKRASAEKLRKEDVIRFFLLQCSKWPGVLEADQPDCRGGLALLQPDTESGENRYFINARYLPSGSKCKIALQDEKVNIFYFQRGESDALLQCFQQNIGRTVSEFQLMPEADAIFRRNDYHEIYSLKQTGVNKLRDVERVEVDKFSLSKFLGKYLRIGGVVNDPAEHEFERDLEKIFDFRTTIENYPLWERVTEILVINEQFAALSRFSSRVREAIAHLEPPEDGDGAEEIKELRSALHQVYASGLSKSLALCWKPAVEAFSNKLMESLKDESSSVLHVYREAVRPERRASWLSCRMADKSAMPVLPDLLLSGMDHELWSDTLNVNLTRFEDVLRFLSLERENGLPGGELEERLDYRYPPYIVTMHELSIARLLLQLLAGRMPMASKDYATQRKLYLKCNYQIEPPEGFSDSIQTTELSFGRQEDVRCSLVRVGLARKKKLRVALSSVPLDPQTLPNVLDKQFDRTYPRYQTVSTLVNQALEANADLLIMPEAFLPFEWLPTLARTSAKNQLAVVTGVEHLVAGGVVYNLTAVILPFQEKDNLCAQICFHLKNHYAPVELAEIARFHLDAPKAAPQYELYCWNDCWFSVYCCFELCSIHERALFQSYVDFLVAVEWNRDVNHYSSIIKSLARDIHCYCIQVNESKCGDSRIVIPAPTEERDLIRMKGGKNPVVLVDEIDIKSLRDFQFTGRSAMKFKPLPPQFSRELVDKRRRHTLFETLRNGQA